MECNILLSGKTFIKIVAAEKIKEFFLQKNVKMLLAFWYYDSHIYLDK